MAIYQRGKIWWIDYYFNGKRMREPVSESKREAIDALNVRKGEVVKGTFEIRQKRKDILFEEFAVEFAQYLKSTRKWWDKELSRVKSLVRYFGSMFLGEISPYHVEKYKAERRKVLAGPSVNRELAVLKSIFNKAIQWEFVRMENPVRKVSYYPERQKERILSDDETRRLIRESGKSLKPVVIVALNTGMRKSEILGLCWKNVDFERQFIRVERSKNNRSRKIPMNSAVREELLRLHRNGSEYVFTKTRTSERLCCVRTAFKTACKNAELENLRFHDLRHSFATNLVMSGVNLVTVKEILGHSDIAMTVRYSHPSDSRKMEAVEKLVSKRKEAVDGRKVEKYGHNLVTIRKYGQAERSISH